VAAASSPDAEPAGAKQGKKTVDTRIHWSDPDEGWIGGDAKKDGGRSGKKEPLGASFADIINSSSESHYELSSLSTSYTLHPN
jgi:NAD(P)H-quinone oxidoreductase subunit T, chloroplastic